MTRGRVRKRNADKVSGLFTGAKRRPTFDHGAATRTYVRARSMLPAHGGGELVCMQVISIMAGTLSTRDSVLHLCRVCYTDSEYKHCTGLFTDSKNRALTSRISELLQISIEEDDGLPTMICRSCLGKFTTIESKLGILRALAHSSCEAYLKSNTNVSKRKRPKSTSGVGVSPTTSRVQPLPKRFQGDRSGKKLHFDQRGM